MKNYFFFAITLFLSLSMSAQQSFHDFKAPDIDGKMLDFSRFKGKKVMVVNVASKCGLTPQYEQLQKLYEKFKDRGFEIVAFPANNFMGQEPGTESEIKTFCTTNYGVTFTLMSKISVKGKDMHPIYQWLTSKEKNGKMDSSVAWNFQKYLIDEQGHLVDMLPPRTSPFDERITGWIEGR